MRDGLQIDIALRTEGGPGCEERHNAASRRKTILCKSRKLPCQVRKAHALINLDNRTVEGAVNAIHLDSPWPGYRRFEHDAINAAVALRAFSGVGIADVKVLAQPNAGNHTDRKFPPEDTRRKAGRGTIDGDQDFPPSHRSPVSILHPAISRRHFY